MGAEIDRLEVQVEAQATKANNQLDNMIKKLDRVASSLMHVNNGGLNSLADGVTKFGQASTVLNSVKTSDFTRLAKNVERCTIFGGSFKFFLQTQSHYYIQYASTYPLKTEYR